MVIDNGESLKKTKDIQINLDFTKTTGVWYTKTFPKVEMPKDAVIEGEENLKNSLKDCKS